MTSRDLQSIQSLPGSLTGSGFFFFFPCPTMSMSAYHGTWSSMYGMIVLDPWRMHQTHVIAPKQYVDVDAALQMHASTAAAPPLCPRHPLHDHSERQGHKAVRMARSRLASCTNLFGEPPYDMSWERASVRS